MLLSVRKRGRLSSIVCACVDGLSSVWRQEGLAGLYRGTSLALVGGSNGAIQFMAYEEMKRWGFERKKRQFAKAGKEYTAADDKLVCQLNLPICRVVESPDLGDHSAVKYRVYDHVGSE